MTALGQSLIKAFASFRTDPQGVEKALEAFVDERIALAKKARKPRERNRLEIEGFDAFYTAFPKRVGRADASVAYKKARQVADAETLLAGARRYAAQVAQTEGQFIKAPAAWLNGHRWKDEYPAAVCSTGERQRHVPDSTWFEFLLGHAGETDFPKGYWGVTWPPIENCPESVRLAFNARKIRA